MTAPMKSTEHYVSRPDGQIYYFKTGHGEPLVFLHAAGLSGWSFRKVIDKFAEHFTCYNIDFPGFDHSDIPPKRYSIDENTTAILDVMESASIRETRIVGSHFGAMVAVHMAANYPERVKRLVLDGLGYWSRERGQAYFENGIKPRLTDVTSYDIPVVPFNTWEEAIKIIPGVDRERWKKSEEIKRKSRYWLSLTYEVITSYDTESTGPRVNVPTIIFYGDGDPVRFAADRAKEGIKGSIVKMVADSPGQVHINQPEEFVTQALPFLLNP